METPKKVNTQIRLNSKETNLIDQFYEPQI